MSNQTQKNVQSRRCLRMALSQKGAKNDRARDERIFTTPQVITIGSGATCTFRIDSDSSAPSSFVLFAPAEGGNFRLQIADWMKGWVMLEDGGSKIELSPKPSDPPFEIFDDGCAVTLLRGSKGKVSFGKSSILFQVIEEEVQEDEDEDEEEAESEAEENDSPALAIAPLEIPQTAELVKYREAAAAAKVESENRRRILAESEELSKQASAEVSSLEEQLRQLQQKLDSAHSRASDFRSSFENSRTQFELAIAKEQKAVEEEQNYLKELERIRREEEEARRKAAAAISSLCVIEGESAVNAQSAAETAADEEEEEEEDEGPLVLPTFENMAPAADHLFVLVILAAMILNSALITAVKVIPMPEPQELTLEDIPERFAQVILPDKPKDTEAPPQEDTSVQEQAAESKKPDAPAKEQKAAASTIDSQKFGSQEERRAAIRQGVQGKGLLKLLGALGGDGDGGDSIQDVLGGGSASTNDIASALMGASGVGVATSESIARQAGQRMGGGTGEAATIGDLGTTGGASTQVSKMTEKKTVVIRGRVIDEGPELETSDCDRNAIARYVKNKMKSIQGCYERELKKNPNLKGKIVVRFTIDEDGKVTEFSIEEETIGNTAVIACIRNTIRIWRFPIKDNSCPVAYPFIFAPSGS